MSITVNSEVPCIGMQEDQNCSPMTCCAFDRGSCLVARFVASLGRSACPFCHPWARDVNNVNSYRGLNSITLRRHCKNSLDSSRPSPEQRVLKPPRLLEGLFPGDAVRCNGCMHAAPHPSRQSTQLLENTVTEGESIRLFDSRYILCSFFCLATFT